MEVPTGHRFKPGVFIVLPRALLQACCTTTCGPVPAGYSPKAPSMSQGSLLVFSLSFVAPFLVLVLTLKLKKKDKAYCRINTREGRMQTNCRKPGHAAITAVFQ